MTTFKLLSIAFALVILVLIVNILSTNRDADDQPMRSSQSPDSSAAAPQGGASDKGLEGELAELDRQLNKTQEDVDRLQQPERSRELRYDQPNSFKQEAEEDAAGQGAEPVNPVDRRVADETGELADKLNSFAEGVEEEFQGEKRP